MACHWSSPANTSAYSLWNILVLTWVTASAISLAVGQMSRKYTGWPSVPTPSEWLLMSIRTLPARA
ncbi:hypothetical protein D3C84_1182150 [compost metagenome]